MSVKKIIALAVFPSEIYKCNPVLKIEFSIQDYILDELKSSDVPLPKVITTEFSSSERYICLPAFI